MKQVKAFSYIESAQLDIAAAIDISRGKMDGTLVDKMHAATLIDELLLNANDSINTALKTFNANHLSTIYSCVDNEKAIQNQHSSSLRQGVEVIA